MLVRIGFWVTLLSLVVSGSVSARAQDRDLSPEEIIRRAAEKESEFTKLWMLYTYRQRILIEILNDWGNVAETRSIEVEVYFTTEGERKTRIVSDQGRLVSLQWTKEDMQDAISVQPFVLTAEELPTYEIDYEGTERVDELDTYVYDIEPKKKQMKRGERYFKGRIWVDQLDLQIVMTRGKAVPEVGGQKFPEFETRRQQIDGKYWFPVWTLADDHLKFGSFLNRRTVHIRELITYEDFQKFEVGTSIKYGPVEKPPDPPAKPPSR